MRRLFGCPDIVSLTEKFLMARNLFRIFTENNPVMGYSKTFFYSRSEGVLILKEDVEIKLPGKSGRPIADKVQSRRVRQKGR